MSSWTTAQIPDQTGRVALVTGATSGLGLETATALARAGAHVVLTARDEARGGEAAAEAGGSTEVLALDLTDLASVRAAAAELGERHGSLDLLVNNAGVMATPRRTTRDGFELQLGTNHLGPFALTGLLLDRLLAASAPRVVTVSSMAHRMGRIRFDDLQGERRYQRWLAYGQSKLANLLFAFELQRRADRAGAPLHSVAAHPGYAATNLQRRGAEMDGSRLKVALSELQNRVLAQDAAHGALPTLFAATAPDVPGGAFVGPDGPFEARGHPRLTTARADAYDEDAARRLWEASEELTGVSFAFSPERVA